MADAAFVADLRVAVEYAVELAAHAQEIARDLDPTLPVAQEAADWGAQLLVVHHPLFLKGVHGVARTTPKGRTLGVLQDAGCVRGDRICLFTPKTPTAITHPRTSALSSCSRRCLRNDPVSER